jgi:hypothetical protein
LDDGLYNAGEHWSAAEGGGGSDNDASPGSEGDDLAAPHQAFSPAGTRRGGATASRLVLKSQTASTRGTQAALSPSPWPTIRISAPAPQAPGERRRQMTCTPAPLISQQSTARLQERSEGFARSRPECPPRSFSAYGYATWRYPTHSSTEVLRGRTSCVQQHWTRGVPSTSGPGHQKRSARRGAAKPWTRQERRCDDWRRN